MLKRLISFILCLVMVLSILPAHALAMDDEVEEATSVLETEPVLETTAAAEETTASTEAVMEPDEEITVPTEAVTEPQEETAAPTEAELEKVYIPSDVAMASNGSCGDNATWSYSNGTLTISGSGAMKDYPNEAVTPWDANGLEDSITAVVIGDNITKIGKWAFARSPITSVTIGSRVDTIGEAAFFACDKLPSVKIPDCVRTIESSAFGYCASLSSVDLGEGVETLIWPFFDCPITSIVIPASVIMIYEGTFNSCPQLKNITVDSRNKVYYSDSYGVVYSNQMTELHVVPPALTGEYTVPASVTGVYEQAGFRNNSLSKIKVASGNTVYYADSYGVLYDKTTSTAMFAPGKLSGVYQLDEGTQSINSYCFDHLAGLEEVVLPSSMKILNANALSSSNIKRIHIPASITEIEIGCFTSCLDLKEIWFDGDAPKIADSASTSAFTNVVATAYYPKGNSTWTSSVRKNYGGNLTWVAYDDSESDYLNRCTKYPTYLTLTSNSILEYIKTLPCSSDTNSASETVRMQMIGETYTATALYRNTAGNYWYQITTSSGESGYVYGGNVTTGSLISGNHININVAPSTTTPTKGKPYDIKGSVTSSNLQIKSVQGTLKDALGNTQSTTITSGFDNVKESGLNDNLKFGSLSRGPGSLTLLATANYYSTADGTSLSTHSTTATKTVNFTVMETYSVVYDANGGTNAPASQNKTVGTDLVLTTAVPTRGGHDFLGWSTSSTATTAAYQPGATLSTDVYSGNLILYAVWGENINVLVSGTCGDNVTWVLSRDGVLTISGVGAITSYASMYDFPWYANREHIISVIVEDGVTNIPEYAFSYCGNLSVVHISQSVAMIGDHAFAESNKITGIYVDGGNQNYCIYEDVLYTKDKTILIKAPVTIYQHTIPDGVVKICNQAFQDSENLTYITFPDSLKEIGANAFSGCSGLTDVSFPENIELIGEYAFERCTGITTLTLQGSNCRIETGAFYECDGLIDLTIRDGIRYLNVNVFKGCDALSKIIFCTENAPGFNVGSTRTEAPFSDLQATAYYPAGWSSSIFYQMGYYLNWTPYEGSAPFIAWGTCENGMQWEILQNGTLTISGSGSMMPWDVYPYAPWSEWSSDITSVVISEGITSIGENAFCSHSNLSSVTIPETVTEIGGYAFMSCESLNSIALPGSLEKIGEGAFIGCTNLSGIDIPESLTHIESYAFSGCTSLTEVVVPESVTTIGESAFMDCSELTSVRLPESISSIESHTFAWCEKLSSVNIPETVTSIADYAFYNCDMARIKIPRGVTSIGEGAFRQCDRLDNVVLPSALTSIGAFAFYQCSSLSSIRIPAGVTGISDHAFAECYCLTDIVLPENLTSIADGAFQLCRSLSSIQIPAKVTTVGENAFDSCYFLSNIFFNGDAPELKENIFGSVTATAHYPEENATWTEDVLQNYGGNITWQVKGTDVPDNPGSGSCGENLTWSFDADTGKLTISGTGAMYNYAIMMSPWRGEDLYKQIKTVVIEEGVTSISHSSFAICSEIEEITIASTVASIDTLAFQDCTSLKKITFAGDQPSFGENVFKNVNASVFYWMANSSWYPIPQDDFGAENLVWIPYSADSGTCGENLYWCYDPDWAEGQLFINGTGEMYDYTDERSPWFENDLYKEIFYTELGKGVESIGEHAFDGFDTLEYLIIGEDVSRIGEQAVKDCPNMVIMGFMGDAPDIADNAFENTTTKAEYPGGNATWTEDVLQNYGGTITWFTDESEEPEAPTSGTCGEDVYWNFDEETGTLTISGNGPMDDYSGDEPWNGIMWSVTNVVVEEGVTYIGAGSFQMYDNLTSVSIAPTVKKIGGVAFYMCCNLKEVTIPEGVEIIGSGAFEHCCALTNVTLPDSVTTLESYAFACNHSLAEIIVPGNVIYVGEAAMGASAQLNHIIFKGPAPEFDQNAFLYTTGFVYYPNDGTWTEEVMQGYGGTITWIAGGPVENRVMIGGSELENKTSVWIDGKEYDIQQLGDIAYVDLPDEEATTMVSYGYHMEDPDDIHTHYPVSMEVWALKNVDGFYTAERVEELDDIVQYSGSSIRTTGKKGIRMITSLEQYKKDALTMHDLAGYTLKEYGTVIAWADKLGDKPLVLGQSYVKSNYAYKKGVSDPVFDADGQRMQYTNVLVNFSDAQCSKDIAMRSYMILEDENGAEVTLYGGIVTRSIGYIAYQNRNEVEPGTESYEYIWDIIHKVYGDIYDAEYQA